MVGWVSRSMGGPGQITNNLINQFCFEDICVYGWVGQWVNGCSQVILLNIK